MNRAGVPQIEKPLQFPLSGPLLITQYQYSVLELVLVLAPALSKFPTILCALPYNSTLLKLNIA